MPLVRPDNFTPPSRTPWGGRGIVDRIKAGLTLLVDRAVPVGESWEVSVEPSFPTVLESGRLLSDQIRADPEFWLGKAIAAEYESSPLLVKLIDTAAHLSVQVHPPEHHPILAEDESGKTEAWIVLAAESDARIYLGFREGVGRGHVERVLREGGRLDDLMNAVPVAAGDVFVIRPGLAHALGAGLTVLEPQRVRPGRRSVTYRYWDWNRRYDSDGSEAPGGRLRELHVREGLSVTDWDGPRGAALVSASRRLPMRAKGSGDLGRWRLLDEPELWVEQWTGTGSATLRGMGSLLGVLCLDGRASLRSTHEALDLVRGQTAVVPAGVPEVHLRLDAGHLAVCCIPAPRAA